MSSGLIKSLLYQIAIRPYIMFVVFLFARFQANPKKSHHTGVEHILNYGKGAACVGLWHPKIQALNSLALCLFR